MDTQVVRTDHGLLAELFLIYVELFSVKGMKRMKFIVYYSDVFLLHSRH